MLRMFTIVLALVCCSPAEAAPPSRPLHTIFTHAPLFGGPLTCRAAWSWPADWGNDGAGTGIRYYEVECIVRSTEQVVYTNTVPDAAILDPVQFDVPYPATAYTFRVYAINKLGERSKQPGKYGLMVP